MLKELRRQEIANILYKKGYVEVSELSQEFHVTEMTIRRDINYLINNNNNFIRKHGGALYQNESPFAKRMDENISQKCKIAEKALSLVEGKKSIFLDSGTTNMQIAKLIPPNMRKTIVTNNLDATYELMNKPNLNIFFIGGDVDSTIRATRGTISEDLMRTVKVDTAFLGCNTIDKDGTMYLFNTTEIGMKKLIVQSCEQCFLLADSNKIGRSSFFPYIHASEVTSVITDEYIDEEIAHSLRECGVNLIIA